MGKTITYDSQDGYTICVEEFDTLNYPIRILRSITKTDCEEREEYEDRVNQTEI